ncbi:LysM peptidoglycan-binding domain-containing protein [Bacillus sp. V5-8f]|uniref:C40 family peptidase n=1 Tax=Bacillus sp. V5-8f TaxID=2053044 RepID=UPI000C76AA8D|nr:peptidoglycan endopeptidase [Bacillus sp. V5-8f]PLT35777.1 peptidoglycan endopeptidase [Bacillus sp. V5-8f]
MKKHIVTLSTAAVLSSGLATSAMASTYTVKSGDSLSKIAHAHNTSIAKLKELNQLSSDVIHINQKLKVSESTSTPTPKTVTLQKTSTVSYSVKSGDTLIKIANHHGITLAELQDWNQLSGHLIYPGQKLVVSKSTNTTAIALPENDPLKTVEKATPKVPLSDTSYTVKKGDYLSLIASKYGVSVNDIKSANNLTSNTIYVGQKLKIAKAAGTQAEDTPALENADNKIATVISEAKKQIGVPYSWAGSSPSGFDCSGFVYYVFKKAGYQISRLSSSTYFDMGKKVTSPQPGDLVFFSPAENKKHLISHMGIYLGDRQFIHASSSKGVRISSLEETYYQKRFTGFRRL